MPLESASVSAGSVLSEKLALGAQAASGCAPCSIRQSTQSCCLVFPLEFSSVISGEIVFLMRVAPATCMSEAGAASNGAAVPRFAILSTFHLGTLRRLAVGRQESHAQRLRRAALKRNRAQDRYNQRVRLLLRLRRTSRMHHGCVPGAPTVPG